MQYAVVCFPKIKSHELDEFREKFDPKSKLIAPHITLVFPINNIADQRLLLDHIDRVISQIQPFDITLEQTHLSNDNYLYLLVTKGQEKILKLHDDLYGGVLAPYLRTDLKFVPHLTIGYFERNKTFDSKQYYLASKMLEVTPFKFEVCFDNINLIQINDATSKRKIIKSFNF